MQTLLHGFLGSWRTDRRSIRRQFLTETDLNLDPSSEIKLHQSINGFLSRLNNIQETLVRTNLVLIASVFVHVRGNQHGEALFLRWHRNRTTDLSTGTLRG